MDRSLSLRRNDFQLVWDDGTSYAHPLLILRVRANGMNQYRFGFVAGKKVGKAVVRNRVKRWMREAMRQRLPNLVCGWDIILIARREAANASFQDMVDAVDTLIRRAHLVSTP